MFGSSATDNFRELADARTADSMARMRPFGIAGLVEAAIDAKATAMTDLLTIGASGLRAYSRALATVGDNIANAQTAGYARRTVQLREAPAAGDIVLVAQQHPPRRRRNHRPVPLGRCLAGRRCAHFVGRCRRRPPPGCAGSRLPNAPFADDASGIGPRLTAIFNIADELASDPANDTLRSQFLLATDDAAAAFRQTAGALGNQAARASQCCGAG